MAKVKPVRIKKRRKPGLLTMMAQKYAGDTGMMENIGKALFPLVEGRADHETV